MRFMSIHCSITCHISTITTFFVIVSLSGITSVTVIIQCSIVKCSNILTRARGHCKFGAAVFRSLLCPQQELVPSPVSGFSRLWIRYGLAKKVPELIVSA